MNNKIKQIKFVKHRIVNELHNQARKNFQRHRVIIKVINDLLQSDFLEMGKYSKYIRHINIF